MTRGNLELSARDEIESDQFARKGRLKPQAFANGRFDMPEAEQRGRRARGFGKGFSDAAVTMPSVPPTR